VDETTLQELATRTTNETEFEEVDFETFYEDDPTLEVGTEKVKQEGEKGKVKITYEITTVYGEVTKKEEIDRTETEPVVDEIILQGTQDPTFEEETKEEEVSFETIYEEDPDLMEGVEEVVQEGKNGTIEIKYEVKYLNNKEVG